LTNWQETTATIAAGLSPQPVERLDDEDDETVVDHPWSHPRRTWFHSRRGSRSTSWNTPRSSPRKSDVT